MVNDRLTTSEDPDFFLEYLLRCALTAPGAATSPTAGRILARLLVVGAVEGGDDLITPYLGPMPSEGATFEVRSYRPGDLVPTEVRGGLRAAAALKIALRAARDSDEGIEVVSRTSSGLERCVMVRDSTGDFEFRFAGHETLIGEPAQCVAARQAWEAILASWRGWTPLEDAEEERRRWASAAAAERPTRQPAAAGPDAGSAGEAVDEPTLAAAAVTGRAEADAAAAVTGRTEADAAAAVTGRAEAEAAVRERGGEAEAAVMPSSDEERDEAPEPPGDEDLDAPHPPSVEVGVEPPAVGPGRDPLVGAADESLRGAIQEAIANLVVEVDLGQIEQLIRRALDDDRREFVEPLARRLSARLGESLELPTMKALVEVLAQVVPRPDELAEAVAADVGALLSETVLRRRPGEPGLDVVQLSAGIEQLQVRLDGLHDQLQKSAGLLQVMDHHLEASDRRAAVAERLSTSVDQEMQRLASRIDEQVSAFLANAGGGSELSDGVARLTRKLRQSVAQLDRALERLDALLPGTGEPGGEPIQRLVSAPRSGPTAIRRTEAVPGGEPARGRAGPVDRTGSSRGWSGSS